MAEVLLTMGGLGCTGWVLLELARLPAPGARPAAFDAASGRRLRLRVDRRTDGRRRADRSRKRLQIEHTPNEPTR